MILTIFKIAESRGLYTEYGHPRASSASGEGGDGAIRQVPQKNGKEETGAKVARLCPARVHHLRSENLSLHFSVNLLQFCKPRT